MIANKTNQMMSTEMLTFDSALLSPADQSFFSDDCLQKQHCSEITSQLASDEWLQDFEDIRSFCDGFEFNPINEPEFSLEAMDKEVETQFQPKANEMMDYLDSTAFMSPLSIEPSSPESYGSPAQNLDSEVDVSAMSLLEEILSANSSDSECLSDQYFDSELSVQCITEVSKDINEDLEGTQEMPSPQIKANPKRQYKRKSPSNEVTLKPTKRSKTTVTERRERKRNQNKSAANRYRQKKRAELDTIEQIQEKQEEINNKLKEQIQKLQMEFKVVYQLAKTAFASDSNKSLQIQMLDLRVFSGTLLD